MAVCFIPGRFKLRLFRRQHALYIYCPGLQVYTERKGKFQALAGDNPYCGRHSAGQLKLAISIWRFFFLTNDTTMVSFSLRKGGHMDITVKYMLRPVAHCKEGCSTLSRVRR